MTELPTGTVTFLFSDVEGSTKLLHELGVEAYAAALAEHRRVVREACVSAGGVEVDTQGDAFFIAFPTAPGALEAARAIAERLEPGPIRLRIGLYTGTPLVTDEGYVGPDVHRAARMSAAASGSQIVVSAATRALIAEDDFVDLGPHRFKDLAAAEHVYQLGSGEFPPIKSLPETNLPVPATPFLGRSEELASVSAQLSSEGVRLLTLTGAGGSGKTRLALQSAAEVAEAFPGGVSWISLTPLTDASLVASSVVQALGASDVPEGRLDLALAPRASRGRVLVLMDNCEHLLPGVAQPIATIRDVPGVTVLATSRERLQLQGEQVFGVPPLSQSDGVQLFVTRAAAVGGGVAATPDVTELCERLDELPLALELAAARTILFSPRQLLDRLGKRLDLLKGGRDADPRQQTLRATIEWSHELLNEEERRLFRRLAVFRGGCTYESAEVVCDADPDLLQSLLDKSLLRRRAEDGVPRYWMLETIREYAAERLAESGEVDEIRRRHAEHHLGDPLEVEQFWGPDIAERLARRVDVELDNIRAALDWAHATTSPLELGLATLYQRANAVSGADVRQRLEDALANPSPQSPRLRARALTAYGGWTRLASGDLELARERLEEALRLYRQLNDEIGEAMVLLRLATVAGERGDVEEEQRIVGDLEERASRSRDPLPMALALKYEGYVSLAGGDHELSREIFERGLALVRGEDFFESSYHEAFAELALSERRFDDALRECEIALAMVADTPNNLAIAGILHVLSAALAGLGEVESAVRIYAWFDALLQTRGLKFPRFIRTIEERTHAPLAAAAAAPEFASTVSEGRQMTLAEAIECARAAIARVRGESQ